MKQPSYNLGVRFTPSEQERLAELQGFLRVNNMKLGDSAVMRALLKWSRATPALVDATEEALKSKATAEGETSMSLKERGTKRLKKLVDALKRMGGERLANASRNDVLRALLMLATPDIPFKGACELLLAEEMKVRRKRGAAK